MKLLRCSIKRPCPVCGKDWCGVSENGELAVCMRMVSERPAKNGGFIHILTDPLPQKRLRAEKAIQQITSPRRSPEHLDRVYSRFLEHLILANSHRANLLERGLSGIDIEIGRYKSMPAAKFADSICRRLTGLGFDLEGVPGFHYKNNSWHFIDYRSASGFLIPIVNSKHRIAALQLRRDDDRKPKYLLISSKWLSRGAACGTPAHFATVDKPFKSEQVETVLVTEGALKANIIAGYITDVPVIGLVSVTTFSEDFGEKLKKRFPNLKRVKIAFDAERFDPEKPETCAFVHVARQRERLAEVLKNADLDATVLSWNPRYKGLDDFITAQNKFTTESNTITIR